ncbi:MAG: zinc ribbon domain-containing protein [Pirellulaceae bacterium]
MSKLGCVPISCLIRGGFAMPIYEYQCNRCDKEFEQLVRGDAQVACPHCSSKKVDRKLSVVAHPSISSQTTNHQPGGCGRPQCSSGGCQGFGD